MKVLDQGYVKLIETWGSDERIIEAARMSTNKGFQGWGHYKCQECGALWQEHSNASWSLLDEKQNPQACCDNNENFLNVIEKVPGDEKLLSYLYKNRHMTPFEMAGAIFEVKAPIFVFREWHRHRTQCLHPDTLIHFDAPKSTSNRRCVYKMRIEDIWRKWQPTQRSDRPERQTNAFRPRSRIEEMQLRCLNEEEQEFNYTNIVDVIRGEPKSMVRVTTVSGRNISLTLDHRVLTNEGWMQLREAIKQGALLTLEGVNRGKAQRWEVPTINEITEEWRPVVGLEQQYEVSSAGRVRRCNCAPKIPTVGAHGYNVVSLQYDGKSMARNVHVLVLEAFKGPRPSAEYETRHLNSNRADARIENLEWGTKQQNADDRVQADRTQRLVPIFEEIAEVEDIGVFPTFDLAVRGPWHNFSADGFVVHNSYNEMSARDIPLPNENYMPTMSRLAANSQTNKQAQGVVEYKADDAGRWLYMLEDLYTHAQIVYEAGINAGVPKELARLSVPVARYSCMRASANLRNWLQFLELRQAPGAQFEIRQFADAVSKHLGESFPRTLALFNE